MSTRLPDLDRSGKKLPVLAGFALLALAACQLTPTWDESAGAELVVQQYGKVAAEETPGGTGPDAGPGVTLPPHPDGCGDRRGPDVPSRDTIASCPLPAESDTVAGGGALPAGAVGVPALVLGDDVLLVTAGSNEALLYDLYRGRQKAKLSLAGGFIPRTAVANTIRICLLVAAGSASLQCFDRNLGTSLWTLPLSQASGLSVEDMHLEGSTLWLSHSRAGFGELVAVNLVNGQVLWRRAPLAGNGRIVRVGDQIVGYDEQPCQELSNPDACLRAVDAATGQVRATFHARYHRFVWRSGTRAVFTDGTEFFEYDASTSSFRDVTAELSALLTGLGSSNLFPVGEPLADGRALVSVATSGAGELVVLDPVAQTFKKLGVPVPARLRVHGDVLVADGAVLSLSAAAAPTATARQWFGIFGFQSGAAYARKVQ